ncbi:MAG: 4Fe-4S dicluster domain-containing protein [Thermodesulfobacteriota bacterium]|nr:4Fe-4S dicluster domain-containing protein [Thermodesulfobacteriota bacterium]
MVFDVFLYVSLTIFVIGLIYKIYTWFSRKIGISAIDITTSERVVAAFKGVLKVVFSVKILTLIKIFILDVVFQRKILKENFLRWLMHMLIYGGFMLLLLMHALDKIITIHVFSDYYSTLNPFFFLRDFFGAMVVVGICIALCRRFILKVPRLKTNSMDNYAIIILAIIMVSGFLLEGLKITSYSEFQNMVEEYSDTDDEAELRALESFWVQEFAVVSPNVTAPFDKEAIAEGLELHEMSCASCHSSPRSAFVGYAIVRILDPVALALDRVGSVDFLWYIHILACFVGLAYLPFSKMFHVIATPVSLLANSVMEEERADPANIATRQAIEMDACTHCGTCSLYCSAMMASEAVGNEYVLPSEKMILLKSMAAGKDLTAKELKAIQEGVYLCTNCERCMVVCPAGINLRELWINVREDLIQRGTPEPLTLSPLSLVRGLNREDLTAYDYPKPLDLAREAVAGDFDSLMDPERPLSFDKMERGDEGLGLIDNTFSYCFGCQNCTTVCPVVGSYDNPQEVLGLLPNQIMCCLGLGLTEMASGSRMIWDCLTCYQCQEHCPQNVEVTDLLYELKNMAVKKLNKL